MKSKNSRVDFSKTSKRELFRLISKANDLVSRWTEAVIMMGAELFIIYPQHEIFKDNYFAKNTLIYILRRARKLLEVCLIKRVIIEYKDGSVMEHTPDNIEKLSRSLEEK